MISAAFAARLQGRDAAHDFRSGLIQFRLELNTLAVPLLELQFEIGPLLLKLCDLRFCLFGLLLGALKFALRCFQARLGLRKT